jgi:hypothetical protein
MSQESSGGGYGWVGFYFFWVVPWLWAGEKDGISGGEVGLIFLWYGLLLLVGWLVARSR